MAVTGITFGNLPVISNVLPSLDSFVNSSAVGYTLNQALTSGLVTWTRTAGTADATHMASLTGTELNAGTRALAVLTNAPSLVEGAVYTIRLTGTNVYGSAVEVAVTGITFGNLPVLSNVQPYQDSVVNSTAVQYTLDTAITSGSVTWTRTSGTADVNAPHTAALTGTELNAGARALAVLTNAPTLIHGAVYTVTLNGTNVYGSAVSVVVTSVSYDFVNPILSNVAIEAPSSTVSARYAKMGDEITLSFTASESINQPVVVFKSGGQPVTDTNVTYSALGEQTSNIDIGGDDKITISGHGLNDGDIIYIITPGSLIVDGEQPSMGGTYIVANKTINDFKLTNMEGVAVVLTGDLSVGMVLTIKRGNDWIAKYTVGDPEQTSNTDIGGDDKITLSAHGLNDGDKIYITTPGNLVVDTVGASINDIYVVANKTNDDFKLTTIEGVAVVLTGNLSGGALKFIKNNDTDGLVTFTINFTDSVGNNGQEVTTLTNTSNTVTVETPSSQLTSLISSMGEFKKSNGDAFTSADNGPYKLTVIDTLTTITLTTIKKNASSTIGFFNKSDNVITAPFNIDVGDANVNNGDNNTIKVKITNAYDSTTTTYILELIRPTLDTQINTIITSTFTGVTLLNSVAYGNMPTIASGTRTINNKKEVLQYTANLSANDSVDSSNIDTTITKLSTAVIADLKNALTANETNADDIIAKANQKNATLMKLAKTHNSTVSKPLIVSAEALGFPSTLFTGLNSGNPDIKVLLPGATFTPNNEKPVFIPMVEHNSQTFSIIKSDGNTADLKIQRLYNIAGDFKQFKITNTDPVLRALTTIKDGQGKISNTDIGGDDKITITAHGLVNGDKIEITDAGNLNVNALAASINSIYVVANKNNDDFKLTTIAGVAVVLTGNLSVIDKALKFRKITDYGSNEDNIQVLNTSNVRPIIVANGQHIILGSVTTGNSSGGTFDATVILQSDNEILRTGLSSVVEETNRGTLKIKKITNSSVLTKTQTLIDAAITANKSTLRAIVLRTILDHADMGAATSIKMAKTALSLSVGLATGVTDIVAFKPDSSIKLYDLEKTEGFYAPLVNDSETIVLDYGDNKTATFTRQTVTNEIQYVLTISGNITLYKKTGATNLTINNTNYTPSGYLVSGDKIELGGRLINISSIIDGGESVTLEYANVTWTNVYDPNTTSFEDNITAANPTIALQEYNKAININGNVITVGNMKYVMFDSDTTINFSN